VQSAREKISKDQARTVIVERLRELLLETYRAYLRADQRACIKAVENLWDKYAVTAKEIEAERDAAPRQLAAFLVLVFEQQGMNRLIIQASHYRHLTQEAAT
jgi:type I restriction enzyme M protein